MNLRESAKVVGFWLVLYATLLYESAKWLTLKARIRLRIAHLAARRHQETTDFLLWILAGVSIALVVSALLRELRHG